MGELDTSELDTSELDMGELDTGELDMGDVGVSVCSDGYLSNFQSNTWRLSVFDFTGASATVMALSVKRGCGTESIPYQQVDPL